MNLITRSFGGPSSGPVQLALTLRPACGLPGDYEFPTDSSSLIRMLRAQTDLPGSVLQRFEEELLSSDSARLLGVELNEAVLTKIGYFID
jgi:hypothetical protein